MLVCTGRLRDNPAKKPKKDGNKSAVAILKDVRLLGCVFQDTEPSSTLRKKLRSVMHHPGKQGPSLGKIQVKILRQRSPYAMKIEDRSQEETVR